MIGLPGRLAAADDGLEKWIERYLDLAVRGVRSAEVEGKIARHLQRFRLWIEAHERVSAVTAREVTAWRGHLAAGVEQTATGRATGMAPATVNNHLAHVSALFSWITAHAPAGLPPSGDPTKRVEPLRLPAPEVQHRSAP